MRCLISLGVTCYGNSKRCPIFIHPRHRPYSVKSLCRGSCRALTEVARSQRKSHGGMREQLTGTKCCPQKRFWSGRVCAQSSIQ